MKYSNNTVNLNLNYGERLACRVMLHLKYNEKDEFYKCFWNDMLLFVAYLLLGMRDPIEWSVWLITEYGYSVKAAKELLAPLRSKAR